MKAKEILINEIINEEEARKNPGILFEQYKLFIEMADNISKRREKTNTLYITLITALFSIILLSIKLEYSIIIIIVPLILIRYFSINWSNHIEEYKTLNTAKFNVINHLENYLPAKGYTKEWELCELYNYGELTKKDKKNPEILQKISEILIILSIILFVIQIHTCFI